MEPTESSRLSSAPTKHSRNPSYNRTPLARRSTRGPLEENDPLAVAFLIEAAEIAVPRTSFSPPNPQPRTPEPPLLPPSPPPKDFSYLRRPEIFHPLSQLVNPILTPQSYKGADKSKDVPPPFRTPPHQPPPSPQTPLPTLLSTGNHRLAAISSAATLASPSSLPPVQIFSLLYTRLACLTLLNLTPLAAEESKCLEDIHSPFYRDPSTGHNILPWELRVLVVRLQGIGYGDLKRSIVGYYDLARDARIEVARATSEDEGKIWRARVKECGICVGNCLVEMGDLSGAKRHFEGLRHGGNKDENAVLDGRLALICLKMGDVEGARRYIDTSEHEGMDIIKPLLSMAEGRYEDAIEEWRSLQGGPHDTLATQNLAVCLLYIGKLDETSKLLNSLIDNGHSFHALTFNLATVYELRTERSRAKKLELAEKVADLMGVHNDDDAENAGHQGRSGWAERGNVDFKL